MRFIATAALLAATSLLPFSAHADERLEVKVEISLRPIRPEGGTRYYRVPGRRGPVFWDPVFPIPIGDTIEIRALPVSGERPVGLVILRLDGRDLPGGTFRRLQAPEGGYRVKIATASLSEGWHLIEAFCQQAGRHPMRASGSVKFLLVRSLGADGAARVAALEQAIAGLKAAHAAWTAAQATVTRVRASVEPVRVAPPPSNEQQRRLAIKLNQPATARPLQSIGEIILRVDSCQTVYLEYLAPNGTRLTRRWQVSGRLHLVGVSVPLTITAILGNRRVSRELTEKNPTAVFNLKEVKK